MNATMIITGGSRGIGAATALVAAERGYSVAINYLRDEQAAEAIVQRIRESGGRAIALQGDVSRESDVTQLFQAFDRTFGTLGVLVERTAMRLVRVGWTSRFG